MRLLWSILASLSLLACSGSPQEAAEKPEANDAAELDPALGVDPDSFVEGNLFFLGYHELGHALVSELDIPVVGREEDAVDRLAIWMMTPEEGAGEPDYLMGAMHGWFLTAAQKPLINIEWWDEHGTDQQRGYQIACLLYGTDAERFSGAADAAKLPGEKLDFCSQEAAQNDTSWSRLLEPYQRDKDDVASPESVTISYVPSKDYADDANYLKTSGLLENIAELMRTNYKLEPGIKIIGKECGEANSFWQPDERAISICYELVAEFRNIAKQEPAT